MPSSLPPSPTSEQEAEPVKATPYTIWAMDCPFRKSGSPVLGNMGSRVERVIIIDAKTWNRLIAEHPSLATAQFRVGEYE